MSINRLAKYNPNRSPAESIELCKHRRNAFQFLHMINCDGSTDDCRPEYDWCWRSRTIVDHVLDCWDNCGGVCSYLKELGQHLNRCRDRRCCLCPYKYWNIDDLRSEEEADEENGHRFVRDDHVEELVDQIDEETEEAEDEE